jgi:hypothetical protein
MNFLRFVPLVCTLCFSISGFSQQDSVRQVSDSISSKTLVTTPTLQGRKLETYSSFANIVDNPVLFHAYAGTNVLNTLRGSVPSLSLSPNVSGVTYGGLRGNAMYAIDGIPFNGNILSYYNFNSFDFESIAAVSNANSSFPFGGLGAGGGFFLRSKSGKNFTKPTFEFNSYTTRHIEEEWDQHSFFSSAESDWSTAHSFAYKQDYGVIDLRASYNFTTAPYPLKGLYEGHDHRHGFKVNLGANAGKFSARLLSDVRLTNSKSELAPERQDIYNASSKGSGYFVQENLFLQYQINDWLKVTSQNVLSKISGDTDSQTNDNVVLFDHDHRRNLHNLFLSLNKPVSDAVTLRAFAGAQLDNIKYKRSMSYSNGYSQENVESKNKALLGGVGADIKNIWFIDVNLRNENYSFYPKDISFTSFNASTAFVFSKLFIRDASDFTGKVRLNYGRLEKYYEYLYPFTSGISDIPQAPLSPRNIAEVGTDLSFLGNRINTSFSWFKTVDEDVFVQFMSPVPDPNPYYRIGELHLRGYEAVLGVVPVQTAKARFDTKFIISKYQTEIRSDDETSGGDDDPIVLGNPNPDWTGSVFTQFTYSGFFVNALLDIQKGGDYVIWGWDETTIVDASFTKFRDITVGYGLSSGLLERMKLQSAFISISGRNLIHFNDKDEDVERRLSPFYGSGYLRTVSLSLSVTF